MATPEYDLLKMAEEILSTEDAVKKIYANPEGEEGDFFGTGLSEDQWDDQTELKTETWPSAVALAEAVKAYMEQ